MRVGIGSDDAAGSLGLRFVIIGELPSADRAIVDLGVLVEDAWQRRGIGTALVTSLLDSARAKGVTTVHADVLVDGHELRKQLSLAIGR